MIFKNIKILVTKSTLLFILLIITQLIAVSSILFAYGSYADNQYRLQDLTCPLYCMDVIALKDDDGKSLVTMDSVKAAFPESLVGYEDDLVYVDLWGKASLDEPISVEEAKKYGIPTDNYEGEFVDDVTVVAMFTVIDGKYAFDKNSTVFMNGYSTGWYTKEQLSNGNPVCVPSYEYCQINDSEWSLNGTSYKVAGCGIPGMGGFVLQIQIPLESMADDMLFSSMMIQFKTPILHSEYEALKSTLEEALDYRVKFSDFCSVSLDEIQTMKTMMMVSVLMALVASFIICLIYRNILEKRVYTTGIYQICGCTRLRAAMIYIVEIFILLSLSTMAGSVLYLKTIMPVLEPYFSYFTDIYSKNITYILPLVYLGVVLVVSTIMIGFKMKKTPKEIMTDLYC